MHGEIRCVAKVIGCGEKTIKRGLAELDYLSDDPTAGRVRRPGACPNWTLVFRPARRWISMKFAIGVSELGHFKYVNKLFNSVSSFL